MSYIAVKHAHMSFVLLSIVLFYIRAFSRINGWQIAKNKLLFIGSHITDTLLLLSAFYLVYLIKADPFSQSWLLEKIIFVIAYISLGFMLLKQSQKLKQYLLLAIITSFLLAIGYLASSKQALIFS